MIEPRMSAPTGTHRAVIELRDVSKSYPTAAGSFGALQGIELTVEPGEFVAVVGRSGSGKSTLLNLVAGIDRPSSGDVRVGGVSLLGLSEDRLSRWRGDHVGIVFQFFQLLPTLTVLENVLLPMEFRGRLPGAERVRRARTLLELAGVADQADKLPAQLSGGQQQRVAVARACANGPSIVVADEPTGNLDSQSADGILQLFAGLARAGTTVLLVTHERELPAGVTRVVRLVDGRVVAGATRDARPEVHHAC